MKKTLWAMFLTLFLGAAGSARADEAGPSEADRSPLDGVQGHLGLGYFTAVAPLGMRYWLDRTNGLDLGLDANYSGSGSGAYRLGAEVGYVRSLAHYHYCVVFWRGGAGIRNDKGFAKPGAPAFTELLADGFIGAELFLGALGFPNVSLQGGYGVVFTLTLPGASYAIATNNAGLNVVGVGNLGFHIYL